MDPFSLILILTIICGQIIKIPIYLGGITLLDIAVFLFVVIGIINLKFKFKKPPIIAKLSIVFLLICLLSLLISPLKFKFDNFLVSFSYILRLLVYFLFGYILYSNGLQNIKKNILKIFTFSGIILSILGLIQLIIFPNLEFLSTEGWDPHYFRVVSSFLDPNFLGAFLSLSLLLVYKFGQKLFNKNLTKIVFLIIFVALLATFSRGAYLMFGISFMVLSILSKSLKSAALTVFLSFILIASFFIYSSAVAEPRNINRTQSAEYRVSSWTQGLEIFAKNPILGVGFNNYRFALSEYNLASSQFLQSHGSSTNDSSLLYVAATTGIVGLISYLTLIISILIYSYRLSLKKNPKGLILFSSLSGLLVHSLFANSLFYPFILIWIILIINLDI